MHTIAIEGQIHVEHVVVIDFRRTPEERKEIGTTVAPVVAPIAGRERREAEIVRAVSTTRPSGRRLKHLACC